MTSRRGSAACLIALLLVPAARATANPDARRVLLLYSYQREFAHDSFARLFRPELERSSPAPVDFVEAALQPAPSAQRESDGAIFDRVKAAFGGMPLDLVVPIGGPAAAFAQNYRDQLFPGIPVLMASVDNRFVRTRTLAPNETAVTVQHDPPKMLDTILRLLPETKNVVVITGASTHDRFWLQEVKRAFQPFESRLQFIWTDRWSIAELLERCRTLPPHSAILYGLLMLDANGVPQHEEQTLEALRATANAPLFGLHSPQLGHGIVGGPLISMEELSRDTAAVALRLLNGEPARAIAVRTLLDGAPTYDARELRRWRIAEARLQAGSVVRFREAPASGVLASTVTGIAAGVALLLVGLAVALALPRSHANSEGAHARLNRRLIQTHEDERASMARWIEDDLCQKIVETSMRLHAISQDEGVRAFEVRSELRQIRDEMCTLAAESLANSDPVYAKLDLLGVVATARLYCEHRCAEVGVALEFSASNVPDQLPLPASIMVFRVVQEAVANALRHAHSPRIAVSLRAAGGGIELEVADEGVGFDPQSAAKNGGLGVVAMQERLHLVGGEATVDSRPGAGTRVRARVPLPIRA